MLGEKDSIRISGRNMSDLDLGIVISSYTFRPLLETLLNSELAERSKVYVAFDGKIDKECVNLIKVFSHFDNIKFLEFEDNVGKVLNLKRSLKFVNETYVTIFDEDDRPRANFSENMSLGIEILNRCETITSVSFYRQTGNIELGQFIPEITKHYENGREYPEMHTLFYRSQLQNSMQSIDSPGFWPESMFLKQYSNLGGYDLRLPIFVADGEYNQAGLTRNYKLIVKKNKSNLRKFYIFSIMSNDSLKIKIKRVAQYLRSWW